MKSVNKLDRSVVKTSYWKILISRNVVNVFYRRTYDKRVKSAVILTENSKDKDKYVYLLPELMKLPFVFKAYVLK